jgi:hypothetical protein
MVGIDTPGDKVAVGTSVGDLGGNNFSHHHGEVPPTSNAITTGMMICDNKLGFFSLSAILFSLYKIDARGSNDGRCEPLL